MTYDRDSDLDNAAGERPPKSRRELEDMLADVQKKMPALIQNNTKEGDFDFGAFAELAEKIESQAGEENLHFVHDRLQCLLGSFGLVPSDNEGEPCVPDSEPK